MNKAFNDFYFYIPVYRINDTVSYSIHINYSTGLPSSFLLDFKPKFLLNSAFDNNLFDSILK